MGAAAYGGKGLKERARVSGERPTGTASFRQQYNQASCHPPPPSGPWDSDPTSIDPPKHPSESPSPPSISGLRGG